jgi:pyridoxal 5'-phosphate synthase pdxS subunit
MACTFSSLLPASRLTTHCSFRFQLVLLYSFAGQLNEQDEFYVFAKEHRVPVALVKQVAAEGRLPVVNFAAGGVATPADCALMMQLGMDGVFVGSGIFKSGNPAKRARACVMATTHFNDPKVLVDVSRDLGEAMVGITDLDKQPVNFRDRDE